MLIQRVVKYKAPPVVQYDYGQNWTKKKECKFKTQEEYDKFLTEQFSVGDMVVYASAHAATRGVLNHWSVSIVTNIHKDVKTVQCDWHGDPESHELLQVSSLYEGAMPWARWTDPTEYILADPEEVKKFQYANLQNRISEFLKSRETTKQA